MSLKEIGIYIDEVTGKSYSVLERTKEIYHNSSTSKTTKKGSFDYITSCGIDLMPLDDTLNKFELLQIDGIITRQA